MTRPLRRPSTVGFPVFHLGGALWAGSGCSLAKRPHKTGRCGSLNTLLQGASQPWRGDTPYPAWPGGWGAGKRPCACRGRTDFVRSADPSFYILSFWHSNDTHVRSVVTIPQSLMICLPFLVFYFSVVLIK